MFEVAVTGWFSAAHRLRLPDGTWEPRHGHNWRLKVTYAGPHLNEMGLLVDFAAVRSRLQEIVATLHERDLNDLPPFRERDPSAELVAVYVAEQMAAAHEMIGLTPACVEVEEEPGCFASYRPDPPTTA
ncbi:MAG: 6-carboxytetrahydropterin synthase [Phycisphaerae bacterium]|jgi:6-pyruvoyltetrahydropterin/6-carboxytetrahydropterin synthase